MITEEQLKVLNEEELNRYLNEQEWLSGRSDDEGWPAHYSEKHGE